jgi:hypothetical protein
VTRSVDDFAYLWTTERDAWVVLQSAPEQSGMPYHLATKTFLLIDEDDELAASVARRMIAEGMAVITRAE